MILIKWKSDHVFPPLWFPFFLTRKSSQLFRAKLFTVSPPAILGFHQLLQNAPFSLDSMTSCKLRSLLGLFHPAFFKSRILFTLGFSMTPRQGQYSRENFSLYFSLPSFTAVLPNVFLVPGTSFMEDYFSTDWGGWCGGGGGGEEGWLRCSQDDSSALHLLFTLFLLLLHQLHLRSSGIRSRKLGTPAL